MGGSKSKNEAVENNPSVKANENESTDGKNSVDKGKKIEKGDKDDVSSGPVKNRGCTDILCCCIFLAHWVVFVYVAVLGFTSGVPERVIYPTDNLGRVCGSTNDPYLQFGPKDTYSNDFTEIKHGAWTMNVTKTLGDSVRTQICGISANKILDQVGCESGTTCRKNRDLECSYKIEGPNIDVKSLMKDPAGTVLKFLQSGDSSSLNPISKIKEYVYDSCVSSCDDVTYFIGNVSDTATPLPEGIRYWTFTFPDNLLWSEAWNKIIANSDKLDGLIPGGSAGLPALPLSVCPYPVQYCVPFPGFEVEAKLGRCFIKMSAVTEASEAAVSAALDNGFAKTIQTGFGEAFGTIVETWYVFIIVAILILIVGFIFLIILRFTVGFFVWISIIVTFLGIAAAGLYTFWYSQACAEQTLDNSLLTSNLSQIEWPAGDCESGLFKEPDDTLRESYYYIGIALFVLAGLYLILVLCSCKRIRLAIALNKVAARFVASNKKIVLLPTVQIVIALAWWIVWCTCAIYAISNTEILGKDTTEHNGLLTFEEAYGTQGVDAKPGLCTGMAPAAPVWKDINAPGCTCVGVPNCAVLDLRCYRCGPARFALGWQFWVLFFSLLWVNAIVVAIGQCTIAGAVGEWYFNQHRLNEVNPVKTGLWNSFRYHLGSLAFGAFILAVVQFIKWWLRYMQKQLEAQKQAVMAKIAGALAYCVRCFERFIKFLNKNAYIRIALVGESFCKAAWRAFCLILRNMGRYAVIGGLSAVISRLGVLFITGAGAAAGYFILIAIFPEVFPWACVFLYVVMGYICGKLVMNVFGLAVDSTLVCFITDEELHGNAKFAPEELRSFMDKPKNNS